MNDQVSTPPVPPLMNDDAARSPTGEILDQSTPSTTLTPPAAEPTPPTNDTPPTPPAVDPTKPVDPAKPAAPATGAPETYAAFKAPDNYTLDEKLIAEATPLFKEMNLSQVDAQRLVDFHAKALIDAAKAPAADYAATRAEWQAKTLADPDIKAYSLDGKTGLDAVKIDIGRALAALGDTALETDFRRAMDTTGAGDNPAFVKAFWRLSQKVGEGKHVSGSGPSTAGQRAPGTTDRPPPARALYPNNP